MNKTVFLHNGSEFDSKYPNGIVPQDELAAVGQYENIFSFVKNVFGVDPASLNPSINITSNSQVDVSTYAYAYVNVAIPEGYVYTSGTKSITNNGSSIDVNTYKYVNVSVPASAVVSGTKSITSNGTGIDVTTYANVNVNVPIPSGYIQPSGTKSITSNGTVDITTYANVDVNVPVPTGYVYTNGTKSITSNGTSIDVNTYKYVDVAVPASGITPTGTYNITDNGTFNVYTYANASVNIPASAVVSGTYNITTNGVKDVTTYASVNVAVPQIVPTGTYNITANGTYDVTSYASAYVSVSGGGQSLTWYNAVFTGSADNYETYVEIPTGCALKIYVPSGADDMAFMVEIDPWESEEYEDFHTMTDNIAPGSYGFVAAANFGLSQLHVTDDGNSPGFSYALIQ